MKKNEKKEIEINARTIIDSILVNIDSIYTVSLQCVFTAKETATILFVPVVHIFKKRHFKHFARVK